MPSEATIQEVRRRLDYAELFGRFCVLHGRGSERTALCVFHEDSHPSMSVNVEDGLYCCHNPACGARGDIFDFWRRKRGVSFPEALAELAAIAGVVIPANGGPRAAPPTTERADEVLASYQPRAPAVVEAIDEAIVQSAHERLMADLPLVNALLERRGLTVETLRHFEIGHDGQRYYIPIRDEQDRVVNIRRYRMDSRASKMISWRSGYGEARLWPLTALAQPLVCLVEGEMDCLLARQVGLNAVTTTGGAGTWKEEWNTLFRGKHVVICYDVDEAGRAGSTAIAQKLVSLAASVKVVRLPLTEPVGADFTDYIVGHGQTMADFSRLVEQSAVFGHDEVRAALPDTEPLELHLSMASLAAHINHPVRTKVIVSGKSSAPAIVPRTMAYHCTMPGKPMCGRCPLQHAGHQTVTLTPRDATLVEFVGVTIRMVDATVKRIGQIPERCGYVKCEVLEHYNLEGLSLIPDIERTEEEAPYVTQMAYYVGHGLQTNRSYVMTGVPIADPKTQMATQLYQTAIPAQSNIDAFRVTPEVVEQLRIFSPTDQHSVPALQVKLGEIYTDLERMSGIYERRDVMLACDLTYHSVLRFRFFGEEVVRGWVEVLILGDTRTGKSTIVQKFHDHYGCGELGTGENTSFAGLVGGLQQMGGTAWQLTWGRLPLNDRRLYVIDEASNLSQQDFSRLTSLRSKGEAEVTKIHTEKTHCRTRKIWVSNPRSGRPLAEYTHGVKAVQELVGAAEDIARFDLAVTAAALEVSLDVVNSGTRTTTVETYTASLCHQRVMWAWSRRSSDIVWAADAERSVLDYAMAHGTRYRYAADIPLAEPNEQRIRIARLAVAMACLFFSTDDGERVLVTPAHVSFAADFMESLYRKPSLGFAEYAEIASRSYTLVDMGAVRDLLSERPGAKRALLETNRMLLRDLEEIFQASGDPLRAIVWTLKQSRFLKQGRNSTYVKTPAAIIWLRQEVFGTLEADAVSQVLGLVRAGQIHNETAVAGEAPPW